jgi:6-phosphogluconate dehydrogenase
MSVTQAKQKIGLVGLAVMGENLALNIEEKGFPIAVYNRSTDKVDRFVEAAKGKQVVGCETPAAFVAAIERPRRIIMMVKAGEPVDDTIASLLPHLEKGDMLVDGGNEYFTNTERRAKELEAVGIRYVGMGVSGGEEGARNGPSIMPGGQQSAYEELAPVLTRIAAQVDDGPCVDYMGPGGAGNYVKMVHNGIEYGDMQLIAEAYDVLKNLGGLTNEELAATFDTWNRGELQSFLIEITAKIFTRRDELTGEHLVDKILDVSGMKGTGKWTVQQASELGAPIPTIASSVEARILSSQKAERMVAAKRLPGVTIELSGSVPPPAAAGAAAGAAGSCTSGSVWTSANGVVVRAEDKRQLIEDVRHALYAAKVCSYAQGMNLLRTASNEYRWNLQLGRIARIWKGGCIIRAQFLDRIKKSYERDAGLANLLVDEEFARELGVRQPGWRRVVARAVAAGIPVPTLSTSLAYFDSYRRERLPANLIQAQRDLFGAHTYQRTDREGPFHTQW